MADICCKVCHVEPKKYKCPTCALPYCSIQCFRAHKVTHADQVIVGSGHAEISLPNPPTPAPVPRYMKKKMDFSILATNDKFRDLLRICPTLLPLLQRVYAATLEPDPETVARRRVLERQVFRGRGSRGRGRGRHVHRFDQTPRKWTQKQADESAMKLLKSARDGRRDVKETEAVASFAQLVEDMINDAQNKGEEQR